MIQALTVPHFMRIRRVRRSSDESKRALVSLSIDLLHDVSVNRWQTCKHKLYRIFVKTVNLFVDNSVSIHLLSILFRKTISDESVFPRPKEEKP